MLKLYLNDDLVIDADSSKTLLDTLNGNNLNLKHSCLNGKCSLCKVKVTKGEYEMNENQEGLNEFDVSNGFCLTCVTKPKTDLYLSEVEFFKGKLPEQKIIPAKIDEIIFLAKDICRLILRIPPKMKLEFNPGQYVNITRFNIQRSYSIASFFENKLEFLIKNYSNGQFSNYLFKEAKINDLLKIEGPKGTYFFNYETYDNVTFVSTGTGIAPHISIITHLIDNLKMDPKKINVIHGQRYESEHVYDIEKKFPDINIIKVNSKERVSGYKYGYVQDVLTDQIFNTIGSKYFICGNQEMTNSVRELLLSHGHAKLNINVDTFIETN